MTPRFTRFTFVSGFLLLAASAFAADSGMRVIKDVAFLEAGRAEKLDLYLPETPAAGKLSPAVVWIHGGGWTGGEKGEARGTEICTTLANAGYVAVSINYKLGDNSWPQNLFDCKNGVRFLRAHAAEYHLDPTRIGVAGGSAGGHLALLVGFTNGKREWEPTAPYPGVSSAVRCVINMYGPTDLFVADKPEQPAMRTLMAKSLKAFSAASMEADVFRTASPIQYATKNSPPVFTFHGRVDPTVDLAQSETLVRVLKERGSEHETMFLDGVGHSFDWEKSGQNPLPRDLRPTALAFLAKHLGPAR